MMNTKSIKERIKSNSFLYELINSYLVRFDYGYLHSKGEIARFLKKLKKTEAMPYDPNKPDIYIVIGDKNRDSTLRKAIFGDIDLGNCSEEAVFYTTRTLKNERLSGLHRLYFEINKAIPLPLKNQWEHTYTTDELHAMKDHNMFVVFMAGAYYEETFSQPELLKRIHEFSEKTYCKKILYMVDALDKYPNIFDWFPYFDYIASYSREDENKYNVYYIDSPCVHLPVIESETEYDIYFRGMNAGRLPMIKECCEKLEKGGADCRFFVQTDLKDKMSSRGLVCSGERVSYEDMVSEEMKASVLLEVLIPGVGSGPTLRSKEAVIYGKKLLTNNPHAAESEFFSSDNIRIFQSPEDIDVNWVKDKEINDYSYSGQYSADEVFRKIKRMCLET